MNNFRTARNYISYYLRAKTKHSVHSPFVFGFVTNALEQKTRGNPALAQTEALRKLLLSSKKEINVMDFGTAKDGAKTYTRLAGDIVKHSAKSRKYAGVLYKIIKYYGLKNILELGTSAGISAMYMAAVSPETSVITLEGCPETAAFAAENFGAAGFKNITQFTGDFDDILPGILDKYSPFDCIFFDGNHQEQATLRYFEQCLPHINNNSVFIFDDINWSDGMKRAWHNIKQHPSVTVTVDLFFMGIVFFRKELSRENFVIRY